MAYDTIVHLVNLSVRKTTKEKHWKPIVGKPTKIADSNTIGIKSETCGPTTPKKIHFRVIGFDRQKVGFTILVGGFNPSEKYSSVGMMKFPTEWKNQGHVPNHQAVYIMANNIPKTSKDHEIKQRISSSEQDPSDSERPQIAHLSKKKV